MAERTEFLKTKFFRGLVIGVVSAGIGALLLFTGIMDQVENTTWDLRARIFAKPTSATDDVALILVDQYSVDKVQETYNLSWPWPRSVYSYLVEFCNEAGVSSLTFDVILQDQGVGGAMDDNALRSSAEALDHFVYATQLDNVEGDPNDWPAYAQRPQIQVTGLDVLSDTAREEMQFNRAAFPHLDVTAPNGGIGVANGDNDRDGVFRRYRLVSYLNENPVPSLATAAFAAAKDDSLSVQYGKRTATVNGVELPVDNLGRVLLKYTFRPEPGYPDDPETDPPRHQSFTAWDILQSELALQAGVEPVIDPAALKGKYVFFGLEAAGLLDLRPTPVDGRAAGVTIHATMLDNLLAGEVMRDFPVWSTVLLLVLLAVAGALAATYASRPVTEAALILGFLAVSIGLAFGGYMVGFWVPLVVMLIAVFVAMIAANVANYATEGAARRAVRDMFGRYLSPDVITELEANPEALELGGKAAEITIYFSDIQKFSTISTKLEPKELVEFLNVYLTPMTNAILEEGGLIDKYEGDAIIALWGAPKERNDHAQAGLRSMLKCQAALDELRPRLREQIGTDVYQRIGMSSGTATVGNMGSELRRDYTMIGDAVNLAARLEGANKAFGTYSMVSEDTIRAAGGPEAVRGIGVAVRELGYIAVVGREDKPVRVYEPMQPAEYEKRSGALSAYQQGIELFQAGRFAEAKPIFERLADVDPAAASYVPRCDELMANPPVNWNGVWVLTEK